MTINILTNLVYSTILDMQNKIASTNSTGVIAYESEH